MRYRFPKFQEFLWKLALWTKCNSFNLDTGQNCFVHLHICDIEILVFSASSKKQTSLNSIHVSFLWVAVKRNWLDKMWRMKNWTSWSVSFRAGALFNGQLVEFSSSARKVITLAYENKFICVSDLSFSTQCVDKFSQGVVHVASWWFDERKRWLNVMGVCTGFKYCD